MSERQPIRRALVSVYDKSGLDQLAKALINAQVEVVSTGSTAKELASHGVTVTEVSEITGFPECFDGRVKTLHPKVHAGILADRRLTTHREQLTALEVKPFDLVVCNLYPFSETVAQGEISMSALRRLTLAARRWCVQLRRITPMWRS